MKPIRVGVWGVGVWGEKHARVYGQLEEAELVGVFDQQGERGAEVAATLRRNASTSLRVDFDGKCFGLSVTTLSGGPKHYLIN